MVTAAPETPFVPVVIASYVEERSRLSVGFRLILAIPHIILLYLGLIASLVVAVIGWFAALILGRLPQPIERFLSRYVAYFTRITAYVWLLTDRYPPFNLEASDWAVDITLAPGRLNRIAVLFRLVLLIPAYIVWVVVTAGLSVCLFFIWLIELFTARMPRALFDAMVAVLRYGTRFGAYGLMVSSAYPSDLLGDAPSTTSQLTPSDQSFPSPPPTSPEAGPPPPPLPASFLTPSVSSQPPADRLVLSQPAKRIVVLFIVIGALAQIAQSVYYSVKDGELVLTVGFGRGPSLFKPVRARNALIDADRAFGARLQQFQRNLGTCGARPEPFRCAQLAVRDLADDLARFDSAIAGIRFPDEVRRRVDDLRSASKAFRNAINDLIAANSEDEYLERGPAFSRAGQDLESAVIALGTELDRLVGSL